jgi:FkbM family methyltransferase
MSLKNSIYHALEMSTPPIVFRWLKKSPLYKKLVTVLRKRHRAPASGFSSITTGPLTGIALHIDPTGDWQRAMLENRYDEELFTWLRQRTHTGHVMYDIGAHIGYHSLYFASLVGATGRVIAFEPNPVNVARIRENLARNPSLGERVTVLPIALSNERGETTFVSSDDVEGGTSSGGFITAAATLWEQSVYIEKTGFVKSIVAEETIDHLLSDKRIPPPQVLKIDVEGAEHLVLKGAHHCLKEHRPLVIVEFHSIVPTYECMRLLTDLGYGTAVLKQENDGRLLVAASPHA